MTIQVQGVNSYVTPKTHNSRPLAASVVLVAGAAGGEGLLYVVCVVAKGKALRQLVITGPTLGWTMDQETFLSMVPKGTTKQRRSRKWRYERNLSARCTGTTVAIFHSLAKTRMVGCITIGREGQTLTLQVP